MKKRFVIIPIVAFLILSLSACVSGQTKACSDFYERLKPAQKLLREIEHQQATNSPYYADSLIPELRQLKVAAKDIDLEDSRDEDFQILVRQVSVKLATTAQLMADFIQKEPDGVLREGMRLALQESASDYEFALQEIEIYCSE